MNGDSGDALRAADADDPFHGSLHCYLPQRSIGVEYCHAAFILGELQAGPRINSSEPQRFAIQGKAEQSVGVDAALIRLHKGAGREVRVREWNIAGSQRFCGEANKVRLWEELLGTHRRTPFI
ncbi:hypothetical protein GCM10011577_37840 [Pseudarthrobacter polychromogenes]|uniref:Uncharacterized protein n=1 Tax=Pseudarthrobacter polychromogenes TaxID=1676 RepID=A0ABQ1Y2D1_9MICC|nr:hypothetical protein GCM10011577_37840 [Pseudarthrobacter polychromogenes]